MAVKFGATEFFTTLSGAGRRTFSPGSPILPSGMCPKLTPLTFIRSNGLPRSDFSFLACVGVMIDAIVSS